MHKRIVDVFTKRCRKLRQNATASEKKLWQSLRNSQLGYKFRRQQHIGVYIVDFYCEELRLIIELDGITHADPKQYDHDIYRDKELKRNGYCVLRYIDWVVIYQIESVLQSILNTCEAIEESKKKSIG